MKILIMFILTISLLLAGQSSVNAIGIVKMTIKVLDENQNPVEGAEVEICFRSTCIGNETVKANTDSEGLYIVSSTSMTGSISGAVTKNNYYASIFHADFLTTTLGMYQPWNKEIKVVLRPKIKPVPMYVRSKWVKIPVVDVEVGFDLEKFDWVAPHGLGTVADFVFLLESSYKSFDDRRSKLTISYSNKFDGMQPFELDMGGDFGVGSIFRTPRYAPESGYLRSLSTSYDTRSPDFHAYITTDTYYFFRVRSEVDEQGKLKRAMYGKLKGNLRAAPTKDGLAKIEFHYWLNPDYTNTRTIWNLIRIGTFLVQYQKVR